MVHDRALRLETRLERAVVGVRVGEVLPDGPASRAGLRVGDIILRLGDQPVGGADDLIRLLGADRVGLPLGLVVLRGGRLEEVSITPAER